MIVSKVKTKPGTQGGTPKRFNSKIVIVLSGGMDSTTLLYDAMNQWEEVYPITFDYGQKHDKETEMARYTCKKLGIPLKMANLQALGQVAPSALTRGGTDIPKGPYEGESMKQTVVPNRNMVFLAFATAFAIGLGAQTVAYGAHGGDHVIYPDCREKFIEVMSEAMALCDYKPIELWTPYLYRTKTDVLRRGLELGVDYSLTWTCYEGKELACGKCGACVERREAFQAVGIEDPLRYEEV